MYSSQLLYSENNMQEFSYGCMYMKEEPTQIVSYPRETKKEPEESDQSYNNDVIKGLPDGNGAKKVKNTLQDLSETDKLQELHAIDKKDELQEPVQGNQYVNEVKEEMDVLQDSIQADEHVNEIEEEIDDVLIVDRKVEIEETRTSIQLHGIDEIDELPEAVQTDEHLNEVDDVFIVDMKVEIDETQTSIQLHTTDEKKSIEEINELQESIQEDVHATNEVKEEMDDLFIVDMKVEIEETQTSCTICPEEGDYCSICKKIVHILDTYESKTTTSPRRTLPKNILELRAKQSFKLGIFTLKNIPEGVTFGPCEALETVQAEDVFAWKLVDGKLESKENAGTTNWMKYVNTVEARTTYNLTAFQCRGKLFFRSKRRISKDEELIVNFGEELPLSAYENIEYYRPIVRSEVYVGFPCTTCCLGFETRDYLDQHRKKYHYVHDDKNCHVKDAGSCPLCKEKLSDRKGLEHHLQNACQVYPRKDRWPKLELASTRRIGRNSNKSVYKYKCLLCDHGTNTKRCMTIHMDLHANVYRYRCNECDYRTNVKLSFETHMYGHRGVKRYKCDKCDFMSNTQSSIRSHALRHDGRKQFKCPSCSYRGVTLQDMRKHFRRHQKKYFQCRNCDCVTTELHDLRQHTAEGCERGSRDAKQRKKNGRKSQ